MNLAQVKLNEEVSLKLLVVENKKGYVAGDETASIYLDFSRCANHPKVAIPISSGIEVTGAIQISNQAGEFGKPIFMVISYETPDSPNEQECRAFPSNALRTGRVAVVAKIESVPLVLLTRNMNSIHFIQTVKKRVASKAVKVEEVEWKKCLEYEVRKCARLDSNPGNEDFKSLFGDMKQVKFCDLRQLAISAQSYLAGNEPTFKVPTWSIPGGELTIKNGRFESSREAALREFAEETGIPLATCGGLKLIDLNFSRHHVFLARECDAQGIYEQTQRWEMNRLDLLSSVESQKSNVSVLKGKELSAWFPLLKLPLLKESNGTESFLRSQELAPAASCETTDQLDPSAVPAADRMPNLQEPALAASCESSNQLNLKPNNSSSEVDELVVDMQGFSLLAKD